MPRSISLLIVCLLWAALAIGIYSALNENSVVGLVFLLFVLTTVFVGGIFALRGNADYLPRRRRYVRETAPPVVKPTPIAVESTQEVTEAVSLFPIYLSVNQSPAFADWVAPGVEIGDNYKPILQSIVAAYQLFVVTNSASGPYSEIAVQKMHSAQVKFLSTINPRLSETYLLLLQKLDERDVEFSYAQFDHPEIERSLEFHVAVDMLVDDLESPFHAEESEALANDVFPAVVLDLARCMVYSRYRLLPEFTGFYAATRLLDS